jgi:acetyl esterase/lipase
VRLELGARLAGEALKRFRRGSIATMTPDQIRQARRRGVPRTAVTEPFIGRLPRTVELQDRVLPTTAGYLAVRCYRPTTSAEALPIVVHLHGGGWVLGDLGMGDWLCSRVAEEVNALVVSVDYCLAPEHPFPAAVDECMAAVTALSVGGHQLGGDPGRIAIMGDSAGGNLAAVVAQQARDAGGPALRAQVLLYPATDATMASPSIEEHADAIVLTKSDIEAFLGHYLGDTDPSDPRVSPLHAAELSGLPPALIQTAEHDPLRDDGARYAEALRAAGVEVRYTEYLGAPHGYINMPGLTRASRQALAEIVAELRLHLTPS